VIAGAAPEKFTFLIDVLSFNVTVPVSVGGVPPAMVRLLSVNAPPCPCMVWLASIARLPGVVAAPLWT
jgi:hypothetical protein